MLAVHLLTILIILAGLVCFFRPVFLLYLFAVIPVLSYLPIISKYNESLRLIKIGPINFYALDYLILIMGILLLVITIINITRNRSSVRLVYASPISKIIIFLFIWELFIGFQSYSKGFEVQNVLRGLAGESLILITILIPLIKGIDISKEYFFPYMVGLGVFLFILALIRYCVTHEVVLTSSMTYRTIAGHTVVVFLFPLCYILFYANPKKINLIITLLIILFLFFGINFSGHRSGYLAFLFVLGMWVITGKFLKKELIWVPLWGLSLILSILLILPIYFKDIGKKDAGKNFLTDIVIRYLDTFNLENKTTVERISKWKFSIDTAKESPLLGLGRFAYYSSFAESGENPNLRAFSELNRAPHNLFANKLVHQGSLGLALLLVFFFISIKETAKIFQWNQSYARFLMTYILSFILFSLFNATFYHTNVKVYFFLTLGLVHAELFSCAKIVGQSKE